MKIQEINLTPLAAQQLLDTMGPNRRLSEAAVRRMANDIRAGRWVNNGETIKMDDRGRLIDGQHRCAAVIMAGTAVPVIMVNDLGSDAQQTVDIGRPRSAADVLRIDGYAYANNVAAVARVAILYTEYPGHVWSASIHPSKTEVTTYARTHIELLQRAVKDAMALRNRIPARISDYGAFLFLAYGSHYPEHAESFHHGLMTGANLRDDDPRLKTANFIANRSYSEVLGAWTTQRNLAIHIKSLNSYIKDEPGRMPVFRRDSLPMPRIGT